MKDTKEAAAGSAESVPSMQIDTVAMDKHLVGGIAWTATAKWSSQIFSWGCMLVVARLLLPADFGLMGIALVYLGLVTTCSEFGFGSAVITLRDLSADSIAQINSFSV